MPRAKAAAFLGAGTSAGEPAIENVVISPKILIKRNRFDEFTEWLFDGRAFGL
jgi:hypothetical protein